MDCRASVRTVTTVTRSCSGGESRDEQGMIRDERRAMFLRTVAPPRYRHFEFYWGRGPVRAPIMMTEADRGWRSA